MTASHNLRPVITVLYLFIAARFFAAVVDRRRPMVFGLVLLAALVTAAADYVSLVAYGRWKIEQSSCAEKTQLATLGLNRAAESALKEMARGVQEGLEYNEVEDVSVMAEGHTLISSGRGPIRERFIDGRVNTKRTCSMGIARTTRTLFLE